METKSDTPQTTKKATAGKRGTQPAETPGNGRTPGAGIPPTPPEIIAEAEATSAVGVPPVTVEKVKSEVKAPNRGPLPKLKQAKIDVANQTAVVVLALLDGIMTVLAGPGAVMNEGERAMLVEPLARMLAKLELTQNAVIQKYSDPVLFLMGLIAWGSRVIREKATERKTKETPLEASQRTEEPPPVETPGHPVMREEVDLASVLSAPDNIARSMQVSIMEAQP